MEVSKALVHNKFHWSFILEATIDYFGIYFYKAVEVSPEALSYYAIRTRITINHSDTSSEFQIQNHPDHYLKCACSLIIQSTKFNFQGKIPRTQ